MPASLLARVNRKGSRRRHQTLLAWNRWFNPSLRINSSWELCSLLAKTRSCSIRAMASPILSEYSGLSDNEISVGIDHETVHCGIHSAPRATGKTEGGRSGQEIHAGRSGGLGPDHYL